MSESAETVGFLVAGEPSPEQRVALERCEAAGIDVETIALAAVDDARLSGYDALWWHRAEPLEAVGVGAIEDVRAPLEAHLADGGGLLLSLRALEAVPALGIDPVEPDVAGLEAEPPAGLLCRSAFADRPVFDGFDELRVATRAPEGEQPCARYERVLPERGAVLASTLRADREAPAEPALFGWRVGDGDVAGLGTGIQFDGPAPEAATRNRERLLENLLGVLAADDERLLEHEPKSAAALSAARERLADDHHRPRYHVSPPENWLNDPNGLLEWNGTYHVFYQYNPAGPHHGTIHWGHAVSDDLVTWEDRPIALTPSPDGPDRDGCWSGCAVDVDGTAKIVYTGGHGDVQLPCLATATDDDLVDWEKHPENPVIRSVPVDPPLRSTEHWRAEFRDHNVWREDGIWHHLIGSGIEDGGGTALLYTSEGDEMVDWTYRGPILTGEPDRDGAMWECPELLDLGEKQLLHVSNYEEVRYYLGEYADRSFDVERDGLLDHGAFYAPQSLRDDGDDRWLTWGWIKPDRSPAAQWDAGWAGTLSLPRRIDLDDEGRLRQRPAAELTALREDRAYADSPTLADERRELAFAGRSFELRAEIRLEDAAECGLAVRRSPDGEEETLLRYTRESDLVVDRAASTTDHRASSDPISMPVTPVDESLSLRLFVDGSVLEVFANERHCLSTRIFPTRSDSDGVSLYAADGRAVFEDLECWTMGSAWPAVGDSSPERN
ncbi:glycoside hydrolase family 32 protein [Natronococcus jeotgali]|uniref:beta-fructofuranosidase n=1 Tax=Natronococcus jeotgali DSM 18795 TaxID=1227498 RepID=L9XXR3_9EURY|nr:glycoside hydrolase family 32 protein [Natronococcus jeotgali]ELY66221.1 sucrose-6-phosphate hydrolase [Natronococcus jeotgali DSM 18795]